MGRIGGGGKSFQPGQEPLLAGESDFAVLGIEQIEVAAEYLADVLVAAERVEDRRVERRRRRRRPRGCRRRWGGLSWCR